MYIYLYTDKGSRMVCCTAGGGRGQTGRRNRVFFATRFEERFFSISDGFRRGSGGRKRAKNRFSSVVLATFSVKAFSKGFFVDFRKARTPKIELPPAREHDFRKIDVFEKAFKKMDLGSILEAKATKN